jgi:hypothetical protein
VACLPMAGWGAATHLWWSPMGFPSLVGRVAVLVGEMGVAVGLFLAAAAVLRCDELAWAQDLLRRRMRRSSGRPVRD